MYNYDDANSLQYIFERDPTKKIKIPPICRATKGKRKKRKIPIRGRTDGIIRNRGPHHFNRGCTWHAEPKGLDMQVSEHGIGAPVTNEAGYDTTNTGIEDCYGAGVTEWSGREILRKEPYRGFGEGVSVMGGESDALWIYLLTCNLINKIQNQRPVFWALIKNMGFLIPELGNPTTKWRR